MLIIFTFINFLNHHSFIPLLCLIENIEKGNFYDENYDECEDFELWSKLSSIYDFKNMISFVFYTEFKKKASNKKSKILSIYKKL